MLHDMLMVAIGGAAGSVIRFLISELINERTGGTFPWGTLTVNIIGCLVIGLLAGMAGRCGLLSHGSRLLLITGLCGGFTTFSTFAYDNVQMIVNGNCMSAMAYTVTCIVAGIAAAMAGLYLTRI